LWLEVVIQPDEVERRANPGDPGDHVQPADEQPAPIEQIVDQEVTVPRRGADEPHVAQFSGAQPGSVPVGSGRTGGESSLSM
jgi:hypothetical protein